jgi:TolA-binding protein
MKKLFSIVLMLTLCCTASMAQQQEKKVGPSIAEWLKGLQNKIAQIVPKKSVPLSTGVAGVRGAREGAQAKLYWKGKKGEEVVTEEEMAEFKSALDVAGTSEPAAAVKEFEKFMAQFPDSPLIPDAKKTLDLVKAEGQKASPGK